MTVLRVTSVANAGVLVELGREKILIDGLCRAEGTPYRATPPNIADAIIAGIAPFDHLSAVLFTHCHSDHYCPKLAEAFARQNPTIPFVVPAQANADILSLSNIFMPDMPPGRSVRLNLSGIEVEIISTTHDGSAYRTTRNYAYRFSNRYITLLHLGDASPSEENFNILRGFADVLLLNFPFITLPTARKRWTGAFGAKHLLILHLPELEADTQNWRDAAARAAEDLSGCQTVKLMTEESVFYLSILQ